MRRQVENRPRNPSYIFKQQRNLVYFKKYCIISIVFPTKYLLFYRFISLCSNDKFFVNHALKFKYPYRYDKGQVVPSSGGQQPASHCRQPSSPVHVGFVVDIVAAGLVFLEYFGFHLPLLFPRASYLLTRLSPGLYNISN